MLKPAPYAIKRSIILVHLSSILGLPRKANLSVSARYKARLLAALGQCSIRYSATRNSFVWIASFKDLRIGSRLLAINLGSNCFPRLIIKSTKFDTFC